MLTIVYYDKNGMHTTNEYKSIWFRSVNISFPERTTTVTYDCYIDDETSEEITVPDGNCIRQTP